MRLGGCMIGSRMRPRSPEKTMRRPAASSTAIEAPTMWPAGRRVRRTPSAIEVSSPNAIGAKDFRLSRASSSV